MRYNFEYYTPENFAPKFNKILNKKYAHLKEHKRRSTFVKDYFNLFHKDITNSIDQWCAYRQKPSIESLINICEVLDCDIDYFLTEQEVFKRDIMSMAEVTGLKYETIEALQEIKNNAFNEKKEVVDTSSEIILNFIDSYVTTNNGKSFIYNLFMYMYGSLYINRTPFKEENYYLGAVIEHITQIAMLAKIKLSEKNNDNK